MRRFFIATQDEIKEGLTTDIYFSRTDEILRRKNISKNVLMEVTLKHPKQPEIVFTGLEEVINLLEGRPVNLKALPEGSVYPGVDKSGVPIPVLMVEGDYKDFDIYETPLLGLICQASGIATKSFNIKKVCEDKTFLSFGTRRMHPAIAPLIDRSAYIGGCDGVASKLSGDILRLKPQGTMPHALILIMGEEEAYKAFDEEIDESVPRIALVDTFSDEKFASIKACQVLKERLKAVRLDTPSSRRGSMTEIVQEVRWELDIRGFKNVSIFVSGGLSEESIGDLIKAGADGFGVGTAVANASTLDFAMDIVEVDFKPLAKKGKFSGRKDVYRCKKCNSYKALAFPSQSPLCDECGGQMEDSLIPYLEKGKLVKTLPTVVEIKEYVISQMKLYSKKP